MRSDFDGSRVVRSQRRQRLLYRGFGRIDQTSGQHGSHLFIEMRDQLEDPGRFATFLHPLHLPFEQVFLHRSAFQNRVIRLQRIRAKHAAEAFGGKYARIDKHCEGVTYIHIMFDQHQLVFAEGAPSESFYPGPVALNSLDQDALTELLFLFPELQSVTRRNAKAQTGYGEPVRPYLRRKDVLAAVREAA